MRLLLPLPFAPSSLVVDRLLSADQAEALAEFVLGEALHADHEPALFCLSARPAFDVRVDGLPTAKVEVADTEIGALGNEERLLQSGEQVGFDVVENAWHLDSPGGEAWAWRGAGGGAWSARNATMPQCHKPRGTVFTASGK